MTTPPVIEVAVALARTADDGWTRRHAVEALRGAAPSPELRTLLVTLFRDTDNDVRRAAGETLVEFARRHPDTGAGIQVLLARACHDAELDAVARYERRPGWDYAYDALWTLTELMSSNTERYGVPTDAAVG